jgi:hypothetical protein
MLNTNVTEEVKVPWKLRVKVYRWITRIFTNLVDSKDKGGKAKEKEGHRYHQEDEGRVVNPD